MMTPKIVVPKDVQEDVYYIHLEMSPDFPTLYIDRNNNRLGEGVAHSHAIICQIIGSELCVWDGDLAKIGMTIKHLPNKA